MSFRAISLAWFAAAAAVVPTGCATMRFETIGQSELPRVSYSRFAAVQPPARLPPQLEQPGTAPEVAARTSSALERAFAGHVLVPLEVHPGDGGAECTGGADRDVLVLAVCDRDGTHPIWHGAVLDAGDPLRPDDGRLGRRARGMADRFAVWNFALSVSAGARAPHGSR